MTSGHVLTSITKRPAWPNHDFFFHHPKKTILKSPFSVLINFEWGTIHLRLSQRCVVRLDVTHNQVHNQYTRGSETEIIRKAGLVIKVDSVQCSQEYRNERKETRLKNWKSKAMNGQHLRQTEVNSAKETWQWMKRGSLKRETESLIIAAQDQALRTNYRKAKVEKSTNISMCRLCKEKEETVSHIVSECAKIAQTEYKKRHDRVATTIHWALCKKYGLPHTEK